MPDKPTNTTKTAATPVKEPSVTTEHHHTIPVSDNSTIKVTTKTTTRPGRKPRVQVFLDADDAVKDQVTGFVDFIREKAIVGLAIGFIVGQQAQGVIKQLITSFVDPAFQLFFGKNLSSRTFTLHLGHNHADFGWGGMIYILLNLLFVLATIYILIKLFKLDKLDKPKDAAAAKPVATVKADTTKADTIKKTVQLS